MITVYDVEIPQEMKIFHFLLLIFELVLICPGVIVVFACGYVMFYRSPQFHVHVHLIMKSIFLSYFVVTVTRLAILFNYFIETTISFEVTTSQPATVILDAIRCAAASAVLLFIPVLTLERVVATLRMKTYEKERHYCLLLTFLFFCNFCCCFNAYLIIYGIPLVAFLIFGLVWICINLLAFQRLVDWSQKEYECQQNIQSLTIRFQLSENVRVGTILLATLRAFCFGVALALALVLGVTMVSVPYKFNEATLILYHLFEIAIASATALVGLTMINADKKWTREFRRVFSAMIPCRKKNVFPEKQTTSVFSLTGTELVVRQDAEASAYFDNLRSQWL